MREPKRFWFAFIFCMTTFLVPFEAHAAQDATKFMFKPFETRLIDSSNARFENFIASAIEKKQALIIASYFDTKVGAKSQYDLLGRTRALFVFHECVSRGIHPQLITIRSLGPVPRAYRS